MEPLPLEVTRAAGELRALVGRLSRRLRQTSVVGEMTLSQASVLSLLEREGPATPGVLATKERISPQSMGAILISLETLGLVSRTPDPTDARSAHALAAHFTAEEQQVLIAALPLLERLARVL